MIRFSEATGRKIVSTATAETVGKIAGFVVDPATGTVLAVRVKKATSGDTLLWIDITAFGADAVTVAAAERITAADAAVAALSGKNHQIVGKRVLTSAGDELGTVSDVTFDGASGAVTRLQLDHGEVAGVRLHGVGSYAVIVTAEDGHHVEG